MHKFYTYLLSISIACGSLQEIIAQKVDSTKAISPEKLESIIDSIIVQAVKNEAFPGCIIYATHKDSILLWKSYGYHTYDSIRRVDDNDIYDVASVTKIVGSTIALMKLYEDGLIHLDDPINRYINDVKGRVGKVTIREALAHQGGLYPWIPFHEVIRKSNQRFKKRDIRSAMDTGYSFEIANNLFLSDRFYEKRIKKLIKKSKVSKIPSYKYSGLFFYLVPEIVQNLTGMSFQVYLDSMLYNPLQLKTIGFNPLDRFDIGRIPPTEIDSFFRMEPIHGKVHDEGAIMMKGVSGNAGLFSNVQDLAVIMQLLMNDGENDSIRFLSPQTVELFTTAQYPNLGNRRGLGFDKPLLVYDSIVSSVAKSASFESFGHTGYTGTLVWADPKADLSFIFLSNRVYPIRKNKALYDLNIRPMIHQLLYDYINQ